MQSGRLRHRLVVERPVEAESTNGERITDWEPVGEIKADLERLRGSEREEGPGPLALPHVKISAKWRPWLRDMTAKWRLRQEEYAYDLISVGNDDMANRSLTIYAKGARIVEIPPTAYLLGGSPFAIVAGRRPATVRKGYIVAGALRAAAAAGLSAGLRKGFTLTTTVKAVAASRLSAALRKASILTGAVKAATGTGLPAALDWAMETSFVLVASPKAAAGVGISANLELSTPPEEGEVVAMMRVNSPDELGDVPLLDSAGDITTPLACCFAKGAVTTDDLIVVDQPKLHVVPLAHWNDGSLKHAAVVGLATLIEGDNDLEIAVGTPAGGSPPSLTLPADTVTLGAASLPLSGATLQRTWFSTPDMIEKHYVSKTGTLYLQRIVRSYSNGEQLISFRVDNNSFGGEGDGTFNGTVQVGDFDNDGESLTQYIRTSYFAEKWYDGGADHGLRYKHDPLALTRSGMAPNWIRRPDSFDEDDTNAYDRCPSGYVVWSRANHFSHWSDGGYFPHLGVISHWESVNAKYGTAEGMKFGKINALAIGAFGILLRAPGTKDVPKPTEIPVRGSGGEGGDPTPSFEIGPYEGGAVNYQYEINHDVNSGYVPYLLTGDFRFWETMLTHTAANCYYSGNNGAFTTTRALANLQPRGIAWLNRTMGQTIAIAPEAMGDTALNDAVGEWREVLGAQMHYLLDNVVDNEWMPGMAGSHNGSETYTNTLGIVPGLAGTMTGTDPFIFGGSFMQGYLQCVLPHLRDIEPLVDSGDIAALMDLHEFAAKHVIGILGEGGTGSFPWTQAATDPISTGGYLRIAPSPGDGSATLGTAFSDWGAVWFENYGSWLTPDNELDPFPGWDVAGTTVKASHGSWIMDAISGAIDHGVTGAAAAGARLFGADNFADFGSDPNSDGDPTFSERRAYGPTPQWGIVPRSWIDGKPAPAWYTALTSGEWSRIGAGITNDGSLGIFGFSGAVLNTVGMYDGGAFVDGTYICMYGGGHADSSNDAMYAFGPLTTDSFAWARYSQNRSLDVATYPTGWDGDDYPVAGHTYKLGVEIPEKRWIFYSAQGPFWNTSSGEQSAQAHVFDLNVASPLVNRPWKYAGVSDGGGQNGVTVRDPVTGLVWFLRERFNFTSDLQYATLGDDPEDTVWSSPGFTGLDTLGQGSGECHPTAQYMMVVGHATGTNAFRMLRFDLRTTATAYTTGTDITLTGDVPPVAVNDEPSICWVPSREQWCIYVADGSKTLYWVDEPVDPFATSTWTCTAETPAGGKTPPSGTGSGVYGNFGCLPAPIEGLYYVSQGGTDPPGSDTDAGYGAVFFWKL